jgi:hypothetical protein
MATSNTRQQVPEAAILELFKALPNWTLLRNSDVFGNFRRGGDCDILIDNLDIGEKSIRKLLGPPIRIARRSYVLSLYYQWGHIDLTNHYYWRGLRLCSGRRILSESDQRGDWPVVCEVHEAIILLLSSLLWGGFIKTRYVNIISDVFDRKNELVATSLISMLGKRASREILLHADNKDWPELEKSIKSIRRAVFTYHFLKHPIRSLFGQLNFYYRELLLRIRPNLPMMILVVRKDWDLNLIRPLILETCEIFEYKCLIHNSISQYSGCFSLKRCFSKWSFRARNGLIVSLVGSDSVTRVSKNHLRINLENDSPEGMIEAFIKFQEKASLQNK